MIYDFSQGAEPMNQRFFYGDFREVGSVSIPHAMSIEFGARLEEIQVECVQIDGEIAD